MTARNTQFVAEPAYEAGKIRVTQGPIEVEYEAGKVRPTQQLIELEYEAGAIRITQMCIELWRVDTVLGNSKVSGSGGIRSSGQPGCFCIRKISGSCVHGLDVEESDIGGVMPTYIDPGDSFPIECT